MLNSKRKVIFVKLYVDWAVDGYRVMEISCWSCYMSCLSGDSHWVVIYYIGLGWLYEKWTLNDLNKNNQFGRNLVFSKWCRGGLKWIWDGFKGIKMAVCCIFNVCSLLIQFYEENWWAVDYGICYNPDVASESRLCSNC
ncbi:hypothetical protein HanRHA438_Chr13g0585241 [Helianthus annuus]|nr:hypothetical protein HanHA300_Chr13g0470551 [Helianthus annuus]KAJ0479879.1 hypothetical protein HanIR_Chr13g0625161 [Helianthus annuus]KAJ0848074.1 hypothetical protein HanPSC8_Chr13g0552931 [Helianthus annuus]KAJ0857020.1 hypothetical protein HanRHA438_Chr13g0585241 [Helianthus annuus]